MREQFRRRRLPHFDKPNAIYFVTSCLHGSIPAKGLKDIEDYRKALKKSSSANVDDSKQSQTTQWKLLFARSDQWLDRAQGVNHLSNKRLAEIVEDALLHFAGQRYAIWAWVVMSNHIHWIFEPDVDWVASLGKAADQRTPRERITHSVNRFSAKQCNQILGTSGKFWQEESYDHCVTESDELQRIINYIEMNPVKARRCSSPEKFKFSSAHYRQKNKFSEGCPLIGTTNISSFD